MPPEMLLPLIMRWMHILSAVFAVGSLALLRAAVLPALTASGLPPETIASLRTGICRRWQMAFHLMIVLFLVSGFYNYLMVTRHLHEDQPLYHALFGVKFLLAFVVFFLGIMVLSSRPKSARWRNNEAVWVVLLVVAIAIVCLGGYMRLMPTTPAAAVVLEVDVD